MHRLQSSSDLPVTQACRSGSDLIDDTKTHSTSLTLVLTRLSLHAGGAGASNRAKTAGTALPDSLKPQGRVSDKYLGRQ